MDLLDQVDLLDHQDQVVLQVVQDQVVLQVVQDQADLLDQVVHQVKLVFKRSTLEHPHHLRELLITQVTYSMTMLEIEYIHIMVVFGLLWEF